MENEQEIQEIQEKLIKCKKEIKEIKCLIKSLLKNEDKIFIKKELCYLDHLLSYIRFQLNIRSQFESDME